MTSDQAMDADASGDRRIRVKISAELLQDGHPGSGSGGEGLDALVARDRRGRPVIWASHVEGVLRDAARRLRGEAAASDFFGCAGGRQQRAIFTSLYLSGTGRGLASRTWRSTARAAFDNRAPKDDTLRAIEHVPRGTQFEGQVELPASDLPLFRRLLQEVDALGRGRATGAGRVTLSLAETGLTRRAIAPATGRLLLLLRNIDPICITATATPDNLIPSLSFVPGRALLGALANWLITEGHRDTATLVVNGSVSVSDALPLPHEPKRLSVVDVLPAPLSLQSEKPIDAAGPVPWWAETRAEVRRLDSRDPDALEVKQKRKLKRPEPDLFVYRSSPAEPWAAFRPQLRVRLRNGRPDPEDTEPSLFAIEQIAEDTLFLCELRGKSADLGRLAAALNPVLEGSRWLRVGRSGAPVEVAQLEWSGDPSPAASSSRAVVTLTSDLLVRDEHLRWHTSLDDDLFQQLPGWPADVRVLEQSIVQDAVAIHGFNGTSRLWRMPAYGIRRGSVFDVEGAGVTAVARMMAEGRWLGERTHEGFGRFRLDDTLPGITASTAAATSAHVPAAEDRKADDREDAIANTTRQWFDRHPRLAEPGGSMDRRPSLSQWLDLVSELERDDANALPSRLTPTTAGGRSWLHPDARAVLERLGGLRDADERKSHARLFVRWLRSAMKTRAVA